MQVMVTGGGGYIGSVVVEELLAEGARVVVYDNLSKGHRQAVVPGATLVEGDLADQAMVAATLRRHAVKAVVHMAADSLAGESMERPAWYFRQNIGHSLNLLEAMLETGVMQLVFSSSAAVYGEPQTIPITEEVPLQPVNAYGESKLALERLLPWYERAYGLRYVSLRYFNAAGASARLGEDHRPETHLVPLVLQAALGRRPAVEVFGTDYPTPDGTCIRDYIHVIDLAAAHLLALAALRDGRPSAVYNLGNGDGFSVRQVIQVARRVSGRAIQTTEGPRRPGDPAVLVASSARIEADLGWRRRHSDLETIVKSAWQWHQAHPNGYED